MELNLIKTKKIIKSLDALKKHIEICYKKKEDITIDLKELYKRIGTQPKKLYSIIEYLGSIDVCKNDLKFSVFFPSIPGIDFSPLSGKCFHHIYLVGCQILELGIFKNVYSLNISCCYRRVVGEYFDISSLFNVTCLDLSHCGVTSKQISNMGNKMKYLKVTYFNQMNYAPNSILELTVASGCYNIDTETTIKTLKNENRRIKINFGTTYNNYYHEFLCDEFSFL